MFSTEQSILKSGHSRQVVSHWNGLSRQSPLYQHLLGIFISAICSKSSLLRPSKGVIKAGCSKEVVSIWNTECTQFWTMKGMHMARGIFIAMTFAMERFTFRVVMSNTLF